MLHLITNTAALLQL